MARLDFNPKNLSADLGASITMALVAVPDAIASAILAGVNPTYGFNALIVGTPIGSLFTSSQFMNIGSTAAMMLAVGGALAGFSEENILTALVTLTVLIGIFQLLLGIFKLGIFTRFISNAVMIGFFTGVATILILGQLGDLTGYSSAYSNKVAQAIDLLLHPGEIDMPTLLTGLTTIGIIILLGRTKLQNFSLAIALLLASVATLVLGLDSVELVGDSFQISAALPTPTLPSLSMVGSLLMPAIAIGLLGLIQAAGISQNIPNPDGEYPDPSGDFTGQGIANVASGFFKGLPLGGSLGGTSILMSAGAKSRWANVLMGLFVAIFVIVFGNQVEKVAVPAIAAVLIVAGFSTYKFDVIKDIWDVSRSSRMVMLATFLATLALEIQEAVFLGVLLSILDFVYTAAQDVQVVELVEKRDGVFEERPCPAVPPDNSVTILYAWGVLFFASARTIEDLLPDVDEAKRAVVILRLHGRSHVGSTFIQIAERYAGRLQTKGGKLMLSGVSQNVWDQLARTETFETIPEEDVFLVGETLGGSTKQALLVAQSWLNQPVEQNNKDNDRDY
ncbi:MAG: SulP family inorganic anion transporter [Chloroflexi bacterium]|nr:SulP family inorganic anion transporter [Chloroflexota bacterium]